MAGRGLFSALAFHAAPSHALQMRAMETSYRQEMTNHEDMFYTGSIKFGGQTIDAIMDTGSFDLVVMSERCHTCNLQGTTTYSTSKSTSYTGGDLVMVMSYGSGDLLCQSGNESLQIGQLAEVKGQPFWEAVYSDLDMSGALGFDVILGIGPPNGMGDEDEIAAMAEYADQWAVDFNKLGLSVPSNYSSARFKEEMPITTVLENMETKVFSVCLGRTSGTPGYLVWNDDAATAQAELFQEVTVKGKRTWTVSMGNAAFEGGGVAGKEYSEQIGCQGGCGALVDSGTSLIMAPSDVYTKVAEFLEGAGASCDNLDALPDLVLQIDGHEFSLSPSSYIGYVDTSSMGLVAHRQFEQYFPWRAKLGQHRGKVCTLLLGEFDSSSQFGPLWILGDPFFREFYTTFDLGSDAKDTTGRKLHLSVASDDCQPGSVEQLQGRRKQRSNIPMNVDASKIHVSKWVREAHKKKNLIV